MSYVTTLSEDNAGKIREILDLKKTVALITIDEKGNTRGFSLNEEKKAEEKMQIDLSEYKYVDLGSLHVKRTRSNPVCCIYWCDMNGCRCLWWC